MLEITPQKSLHLETLHEAPEMGSISISVDLQKVENNMNVVLKNKNPPKPSKFKVLKSVNSERLMGKVPEPPRFVSNPKETQVFYYIPLAN